MKKSLSLFAFLLIAIAAFAQEPTKTYLWPIKGEKAGSNIISAPQCYIGDELNFNNLFIGAPEGTTVVSPVDGTITFISVDYMPTLHTSTSFTCDGSFNQVINEVIKDLDKSRDPKYLSGSLGIRSNDGNVVWISGLGGDELFKTGQKIKQGTPLGTVSYCYSKIQKPSINLGISRNTRPADPMTPFGIKSSFIPPGEIKPVTSLTKEQAKEDFLIYIDALKEEYPGLYNVVTKEELEQYVTKTVAQIDRNNGNLDFDQFWSIMRGAVAKIHDSHISLYPPMWNNTQNRSIYKPKIMSGWINDTLICTNAIKEYEHLIGRQIVSVNGIAADSMKKIVTITSNISSYDAKVEQYVDYYLATVGFFNFFSKPYGSDNYDMTVEFIDGQKHAIKGDLIKRGSPYMGDRTNFYGTNLHKDRFLLKELNDSTAYIGLSTFALNQVQVEEIAAFIDSVSDKKHLIIDVRNNNGGEDKVIGKLFSYIAGEPMVLNGYSKVNKTGVYESFKYSTNHFGLTDGIFSDYKQEQGKEGYYLRSESGNIFTPDSTINYKGKIYVLTNENSISAATLFPALVVRNHRGVIVGRETRTAYHFMNALKFDDVKLPHSTITITIPLVETYFDAIVNDRVPFGRGVVPDYFVPLTLDELTFKNGDAILNYTLELIRMGNTSKETILSISRRLNLRF